MSKDNLPEFFFRTRENGAIVFRVNAQNRDKRIEMIQIAVVNVKNGQIKPHGRHQLSPQELASIKEWMADRVAVLANRDVEDILRAVDHLNLTTQWAQSKATEAQLEAVTDRLLLAMHDLRSVLAQKKAERLSEEKDTRAVDG